MQLIYIKEEGKKQSLKYIVDEVDEILDTVRMLRTDSTTVTYLGVLYSIYSISDDSNYDIFVEYQSNPSFKQYKDISRYVRNEEISDHVYAPFITDDELVQEIMLFISFDGHPVFITISEENELITVEFTAQGNVVDIETCALYMGFNIVNEVTDNA